MELRPPFILSFVDIGLADDYLRFSPKGPPKQDSENGNSVSATD